jgi:hypothetical protein
MLATYCSENNSRNWVDALPIIQAKKNGRLHSGIGRPPYVAMFGRDMKVGISNEQISPDVMNQIESEKDLAAIYQSPKTNKLQPEEELVQDVDVSDQRFEFQDIPAEIAQEVVETTFGSSPEQELYDFGALLDRIQHERSEAERNLKRQAERMLSASNKR